MKAAVEGTWVLTLGTEESAPLTLQVVESSKAQPDQLHASQGRRSGLVRPAAACGTRTFVASAGACIDSSEMALDVLFVGGPDAYRGVEMSGRLVVRSLTFSRGEYGLTIGNLLVTAQVAPDGTVSAATARQADGSAIPVASLVRTTR